MKKVWLVVIGVIALLAITNPTVKDFNDYSAGENQRTGYFLIFSLYKHTSRVYPKSTSIKSKLHTELNETPRVYTYTSEYIGIFKNFILIKSY